MAGEHETLLCWDPQEEASGLQMQRWAEPGFAAAPPLWTAAHSLTRCLTAGSCLARGEIIRPRCADQHEVSPFWERTDSDSEAGHGPSAPGSSCWCQAKIRKEGAPSGQKALCLSREAWRAGHRTVVFINPGPEEGPPWQTVQFPVGEERRWRGLGRSFSPFLSYYLIMLRVEGFCFNL